MKWIARHRDRAIRLFFLFAAAFFLGYVGLRAARVAITFDEAHTYLSYVAKGFLGVFDFDTANNHFLNTLLVWLFSRFAGSSEFVLRVPSLLGYLLYLVFSYRLLMRYARPFFALAGFLLLNLNPYLLDFFGLSRGYGLSIGLLMAAFYYFLRFIDQMEEGSPDVFRSLVISLAAAAFAVLSNFSLLDVYIILVLYALMDMAFSSHKKRPSPISFPRGKKHTFSRSLLWLTWGIFAILINGLAIAFNLSTSSKMYEPVAVKLVGLSDEEQKGVELNGLNLRKWDIPMTLKAGIWMPESLECMTGINLKAPVVLLRKIRDIETRIGPRTFHNVDLTKEIIAGLHDREAAAFSLPKNVSLAPPFVSKVKTAINWKGNRTYIILVAKSWGLALGAILVFWMAISLAGQALRRLRILNADQLRPLMGVTVGLASLAAVPIFLLKANQELYFGGTEGVVRDTFLKLIDDSFYGRLYMPYQSQLVLGLILLTVALFFIRYAIAPPWKGLRWRRPEAVFIVVLGFMVLAVWAQHVLLHTPYLAHRTALFFIPVTALFIIFTLSSLGPDKVLSILGSGLLIVFTALAAYHFSRVANMSITVDWRSDADNKAIIADLTRIRAENPSAYTNVKLGVEWVFYPSLEYESQRKKLSWLRIEMVPPFYKEDFYFLQGPFDESRMILVKQYDTGNILVKEKGSN
jgi:hypothetical protein